MSQTCRYCGEHFANLGNLANHEAVCATSSQYHKTATAFRGLCARWYVPIPQVRQSLPTDPCDYTSQHEVRLNVEAAIGTSPRDHAAHVFGHYLCSLHAAAGEQEDGAALCDLVAEVIARMATREAPP